MSSAISVMAHSYFGINTYNRPGLVSRQDEKRIDIPKSGYKIKPVADNAAELSVSEKLRMQTSGLARNTYYEQATLSGMQIAGRTLDRVNELLGRITELSAQGAKADNSDEDRRSIQNEILKLLYEIDKVSNEASFTGNKEIPVDKMPAETKPVVNTENLGIDKIDVSTEEGAEDAVKAVDAATEYVTKLRDDVTTAQTNVENALLSKVEPKEKSDNTDEMVKQSLTNILNHFDQAVSAQANQSGRGAMSLLM